MHFVLHIRSQWIFSYISFSVDNTRLSKFPVIVPINNDRGGGGIIKQYILTTITCVKVLCIYLILVRNLSFGEL